MPLQHPRPRPACEAQHQADTAISSALQIQAPNGTIETPQMHAAGPQLRWRAHAAAGMLCAAAQGWCRGQDSSLAGLRADPHDASPAVAQGPGNCAGLRAPGGRGALGGAAAQGEPGRPGTCGCSARADARLPGSHPHLPPALPPAAAVAPAPRCAPASRCQLPPAHARGHARRHDRAMLQASSFQGGKLHNRRVTLDAELRENACTGTLRCLLAGPSAAPMAASTPWENGGGVLRMACTGQHVPAAGCLQGRPTLGRWPRAARPGASWRSTWQRGPAPTAWCSCAGSACGTCHPSCRGPATCWSGPGTWTLCARWWVPLPTV